MPLDLGPIVEHVIQQALRTLRKEAQESCTLPPEGREARTKQTFYDTIATILNTESPQPHCHWSATPDGVQCIVQGELSVLAYRAFEIPFPLQGDTL